MRPTGDKVNNSFKIGKVINNIYKIKNQHRARAELIFNKMNIRFGSATPALHSITIHRPLMNLEFDRF